jgi:hypothetical protein
MRLKNYAASVYEASGNPNWKADSWNPCIRDVLHNAEELSDVELAAIKGTF